MKTILLIDDDEATNYFNEAVIMSTGLDFKVEMVYSAKDGLNYLSGKGKFEGRDTSDSPEIIFLDINMPGMSGWDFLEEYEKLNDEKKADIIIAMLTTSLNPDDKSKAEDIKEIKQFMHKPLTVEQVKSLVNQNFKAK